MVRLLIQSFTGDIEPGDRGYGVALVIAWASLFVIVMLVTAAWFKRKIDIELAFPREQQRTRMTYVAESQSNEGTRKLTQQGYQRHWLGSTVLGMWFGAGI